MKGAVILCQETIPGVTKLQASRSRQSHTTLQHEQRSSGESNALRDSSLQPAVNIFDCNRTIEIILLLHSSFLC
jgi:hypothetical protein